MRAWLVPVLLLAVLPACPSPDTPEESRPPKDGADPDDTAGTDSATDPDTDTDPPVDTSATTDTGEPLVPVTGSASAVMSTDNPHLAIVTVTVDHDATVWVEYGQELPGAQSTPTHSLTAGVPAEILVHGLKAGFVTSLVVHADAEGAAPWTSDPIEMTAAPLAAGFQRCLATTYADHHDPDEIYCTNGTSSAGRTYFCVDHSGDVVYQIASVGTELLYSMQPLTTGGWAAASTTSSLLVLFDERSTPYAQYTPGYFSGKTRWDHQFIDNHEIIEITEGKWKGALAFITDSYEYVPGYDWVFAQGLIVFDPVSGDVLWDWSTFGDLNDGVANDPLLDYTRTGPGGFSYDFGHGNSLAHRIDADGREVFWMSLRAQDWIIKIDVETDAIVWRFGEDGDFELHLDVNDPTSPMRPVSDYMFGQHAIQFRDVDGSQSSFTIFDNGYYRNEDDGSWSSSYSRMVEYRIDEDTMMAQQVFAYGPKSGYHPEYLYAWGMGDAEILPDGARAAWSSGYGVGSGYGGPFLREVSYPDGELLWSLDCIDYGDGFYRFNWFPSLYEMEGRPWR